jgi:hypothetical protein
MWSDPVRAVQILVIYIIRYIMNRRASQSQALKLLKQLARVDL